MNSFSEKRLYISQMTAGYLTGKSLCDVLGECLFILPKDGMLYGRIDDCIRMLMTGEGLPEKYPLRSSLSVIDEGEPSLVILHDMIAETEETGRIDTGLFRTYEEMISYMDEDKSDAHRRTGRKNDKYAVMYERLKKCRRKGASKRLRKEIINGMKNELILCMASMVAYTGMTGVSQALKKTAYLMRGFLKTELKKLRNKYEAGEDVSDLCRGFLKELELPELTQCFTCCFEGEEKNYTLPMGSGLFFNEVNRKRRIPGKEICTVILAVVVGVMGIMGMLTREDKKEGRLKSALSEALITAVGEMKDEKGTNQIMAGFMQQMLKQVDDDIDLTVRICDLDELDQTMEVEAIGEYDSFLGNRRRISVRRRLSF